MQAEAAGLHVMMGAAAHLIRRSLLAVIAQPHSHARAQFLDRERDRLIVPQIVSVTNDVGASLIDPEHHQCSLFFRERMARQKFAHEVPHQREVRGVAGELELSSFHWPTETRAQLGAQSSPDPKPIGHCPKAVVQSRACGKRLSRWCFSPRPSWRRSASPLTTRFVWLAFTSIATRLITLFP